MTGRILHGLFTRCCRHEWVRRHQDSRIYVECLKCLATSPGVDLTPDDRQRLITEMADGLRASGLVEVHAKGPDA